MRYYQTNYTYDDFTKEKEVKTNVNYFQSPEESENENIEDDLDIGSEDEADKLNKLDLDQAYELYLTKKSEIIKSYEMMTGVVQPNNINNSNDDI